MRVWGVDRLMLLLGAGRTVRKPVAEKRQEYRSTALLQAELRTPAYSIVAKLKQEYGPI